MTGAAAQFLHTGLAAVGSEAAGPLSIRAPRHLRTQRSPFRASLSEPISGRSFIRFIDGAVAKNEHLDPDCRGFLKRTGANQRMRDDICPVPAIMHRGKSVFSNLARAC